MPELRDAVGNGLGITYTQWELYLAFHHGRRRLIFEVNVQAPLDLAFRLVDGERERGIRGSKRHFAVVFPGVEDGACRLGRADGRRPHSRGGQLRYCQ